MPILTHHCHLPWPLPCVLFALLHFVSHNRYSLTPIYCSFPSALTSFSSLSPQLCRGHAWSMRARDDFSFLLTFPFTCLLTFFLPALLLLAFFSLSPPSPSFSLSKENTIYRSLDSYPPTHTLSHPLHKQLLTHVLFFSQPSRFGLFFVSFLLALVFFATALSFSLHLHFSQSTLGTMETIYGIQVKTPCSFVLQLVHAFFLFLISPKLSSHGFTLFTFFFFYFFGFVFLIACAFFLISAGDIQSEWSLFSWTPLLSNIPCCDFCPTPSSLPFMISLPPPPLPFLSTLYSTPCACFLIPINATSSHVRKNHAMPYHTIPHNLVITSLASLASLCYFSLSYLFQRCCLLFFLYSLIFSCAWIDRGCA